MSWFEKLMPSRIRTDAARKRGVPEGLWIRCKGCEATLYHAELERNLDVCPKCGHHERMSGRRRLETFLDPDCREEIGATLTPNDPLRFRDSKKYRDRLAQAQKDTGETDALIAMSGRLLGEPIVACAFDFRFMGGSMGSVVGERFVRAVDRAREQRCPLVCFSASGGARMQEALFSLMQMAKTSAALARLRADRLPFISVMTDPTMGGVSASLAMLGDLNLAEPKALIGFAGPRVIQQTVRETLPEGFQRSEFLVEHGAIDRIVDRRQMRQEIALLLSLLGARPSPARPGVKTTDPDEASRARPPASKPSSPQASASSDAASGGVASAVATGDRLAREARRDASPSTAAGHDGSAVPDASSTEASSSPGAAAVAAWRRATRLVGRAAREPSTRAGRRWSPGASTDRPSTSERSAVAHDAEPVTSAVDSGSDDGTERAPKRAQAPQAPLEGEWLPAERKRSTGAAASAQGGATGP